MYQTNEITMGLQFEWEGSGGGNFIPQVPFITIIYMEYSIMNKSLCTCYFFNDQDESKCYLMGEEKIEKPRTTKLCPR